MKKSDFEVGMKVKIREDLEVGTNYNEDASNDDWYAVEEMLEYVGKTVTIKSIYDDRVSIVEDGDDGESWGWQFGMFEKTTLTSSIIKFAKVKPNAIIPSKREEDGCFDLYACFEEESMIIAPHTVKLIPTGLASAFSPKYRIDFRERGTNTKSNLKVSAGQIDSGYRGEYFVALHNDNDIPVEITKSINDFEKTEDFIRVPYSKAVCQFAVVKVPQVDIEEVSYEELKLITSERGTGQRGSSGK